MSSDFQTPPLQVSRPVSACSACRRAKIKCDGKLPACSACEKHGKSAECSSSSSQFARGKERSYVASLEAKIERLEQRKAQLTGKPFRPSNQVDDFTNKDGGGGGDSGSNGVAIGMAGLARKRAEGAQVEELISDLGFITVNATSKGLYDFTEDMSFSKLILRAASLQQDIVPSITSCPLPDRDTALRLIQHYLDTIFSHYPFFDETSLFMSVHAVFRDETTASSRDLYICYMVLAIATVSISKGADATAKLRAAGYVTAAIGHSRQILVPYSTIGIQATLLLIQYALLEPATYNPWYLIGVASRIMIDLGLHQDLQKSAKQTANEAELRRRIFYSVYTYDRYISMTYERPYSFSDEAINVRLPRPEGVASKIANWSGQPITLTLATEMFKFSKLNSQWYQYLWFSERKRLSTPRDYSDSKRKELGDWYNNLPTSIDQTQLEMLKLEYFYMRIYLDLPNPRVHDLTEPVIVLIVENSFEYVRLFQKLLLEGGSRFHYTYCDAIRAYNLGQKLTDILSWRGSTFLSGPSGYRAKMALTGIRTLLDMLVQRWTEIEKFRERFYQDSEALLAQLRETTEAYVSPQQSPQAMLRGLEDSVAREGSPHWAYQGAMPGY
ncbi:hypothetical protein DRE_00267 [Drechslerella stenobrocha 248]|uniref:Zn(2)-C6 fungal-type domain-containing protein n=1 Tax=Drechslerella stenobrocha 248 TaxID=1043628 RepID=W7IA52_9PEZI|nr:hypothetical protein DRE_00267 [Drechslerella stenobrocha 248]